MKTFYLYNKKDVPFKTQNSLLLFNALKQKYKVKYLSLDAFDQIEKNSNSKTLPIHLLEDLEKIKKTFNDYDCFKINTLTRIYFDNNALSAWFNQLKEILIGLNYDYLLISSSYVLGNVNTSVFNITDCVVVPIDIEKENSLEMFEYLMDLYKVTNNKFKIIFLPIGNKNNDKLLNSTNLIKIKNNVNDLLINHLVLFDDKTNINELLKQNDYQNEYNNIIQFLIKD